MKYLDRPLRKLAAFTEASEALDKGKGPVSLVGTPESAKVHIMNQAGTGHARLIVTYDEMEARALLEDYRFFSSEVFLFPEKDLLFYQADIRSNNLVRDRMNVIRKLGTRKPEEDIAVICSIGAVMNAMAPPEAYYRMELMLSEGSFSELEALALKLVQMGYERVPKVENPGEFAVHGGILDIYDLTQENPYRIDFWDTEIDTIRTFSPESQLTIERLPEVLIGPAAEPPIQENHLCTLPDFFPEDVLIFLEEPNRMQEYGKAIELEFQESFKERLEKGLSVREDAFQCLPADTVLSQLDTKRTLVFSGLDSMTDAVRVRETFYIDARSVVSYAGNFGGLKEDLERYQHQKYSVVLLTVSRTRGSRMAEELRDFGLKAYFSEEDEEEVKPGTILVAHGNLHRGYTYPALKFVLLSEGDIFGVEKKKRRRRRTSDANAHRIRTFSELSAGDYVVHENYGIGVYQGITQISTEGVLRDYLKIVYGKSGTLYIPVTNLDVVQKYASADARPPHISRLDSPDWKRTKARVKAAVQEVAEELVRLYAIRQNGRGFKYSEDTVWQKEFEELFPYEETEDQLEAIEDTKRDMESGKIMDRLICGDVGFGKTEVAIRAAFKAVQEDKQVAYLVPTTILAQQHFNTFRERMQQYPVTVELLSRFRNKQEQTKTIQGLKKGSVDIVIGTHRILSKDVVFKDLGLLIIDEEQRFGVAHKEKIKQLKNDVDVLTLTATPIPRTLHMSMIGVRDMSVLEEAPTDRQAIQTYVMEYSEELVREAISRELKRGGQVYYVYNRVQDIADVTAAVQELVPDAVVSYAHGKMSERELEKRMLAFIEGEIDVLVSTTIIETGLDIPNVNTIIVHDAERYGLSQLYQLRGRVGRSSRQAYAFIMYRKNRIPSEDAQKRLEAIRQFTELGSGIRIAMEDLEIRGAGAVLGNAQSGHMTEVGYELYCKMLSEAVRKEKGEEEPGEKTDTLLDIRIDAYIPSSYIPNESLKLEVYKKISFLETDEEKAELSDELIDRYGDIPEPVERLMETAVLRSRAGKLWITEIKGNERELTFRFSPEARLKSEGLPELLNRMQGAMRFLPGEQQGLLYRQMNAREKPEPILALLDRLLAEMEESLA